LIVDTSVLLALFDGDDRAHEAVMSTFDAIDEPMVLSPYVVAELDYMIASRLGVPTELVVLEELASGSWELAPFGTDDLQSAVGVIEKYADLNIGLADASIVVLADRYRTRTIATLDRRHFGAVRPLSGGRFRIVP
jgi:uncharacterized protein